MEQTSLEASRCIFETRKCLTEFFGGDNVSGLIFTSNATEALNTVIHGLFNDGDTVITTNLEHNSVLRPLYYAGERGVKTEIVSCSDNGFFDADAIEDMITKAAKAIICTHASNLTGMSSIYAETFGSASCARSSTRAPEPPRPILPTSCPTSTTPSPPRWGCWFCCWRSTGGWGC